MNPWRKLILFLGIVIGPAIFVGYSNFSAFPDSSGLATLMLIITVIIAGVFTWKSNEATRKIQQYCVIADVVICAILCVNMGCHWILVREVSAAKQATVERHTEEDREEARKTADTERQLALKKAEADLAKAEAERAAKSAAAIQAEARRLAQLPRSMRRNSSPVAVATARPATPETTKADNLPAEAAPPPATIAPKATEEEVRNRWWWILTTLAFAECFASVLAGAILVGAWEWDRNKDGIADHLQSFVGKT